MLGVRVRDGVAMMQSQGKAGNGAGEKQATLQAATSKGGKHKTGQGLFPMTNTTHNEGGSPG